jgi:hypothetical protein
LNMALFKMRLAQERIFTGDYPQRITPSAEDMEYIRGSPFLYSRERSWNSSLNACSTCNS